MPKLGMPTINSYDSNSDMCRSIVLMVVPANCRWVSPMVHLTSK